MLWIGRASPGPLSGRRTMRAAAPTFDVRGACYALSKMSNEHPGWGGARAGAGRKKSMLRRHDPPHRTRPAFGGKLPVHVVLRVGRDVPRLRCGRTYRVIRRVLAACRERDAFRVVHASIQHNHLHFLVEARDRTAMIRGMQGLAIRLARAINHDLDRTGAVFEHRYHATTITSTRQAHRALAYVINNWRHHREDLASEEIMQVKLDPYASGLAFPGWSGAPRFRPPPWYAPLPVAAPHTWLLREGWMRHGPLDLFAIPGPLR